MVRIEFSLHCGLDLECKEIIVIAETKELALEYVKNKYRFRDTSFSESIEDSLKITNEEYQNIFIIKDRGF